MFKVKYPYTNNYKDTCNKTNYHNENDNKGKPNENNDDKGTFDKTNDIQRENYKTNHSTYDRRWTKNNKRNAMLFQMSCKLQLSNVCLL